ncbi:MAG: ROK family protein [Clostridia bacterium]|nr:ROK family protein [Clostridia bacterium]
MSRTALCFDIGGSKYNVGLMDEGGRILAQSVSPWAAPPTAESVPQELFACADALLAGHPQWRPDVAGATIPGLADPEKGLWIEAAFSGIRGLPIRNLIESRYSLPAAIDNDGQACALAERVFGCCKGVDDFLYLTVSNGVGGAVVLGGRPYGGCALGAGEIGHFMVVEDGRLCPCGNRGCLEAHAAGPGISKNYRELGGPSALSAREIAQLARKGDPTALETFRLEGRYLGTAISWAVNLLNPAKVIIGGGVSLAFDLFEESLRDTLSRHIYRRANATLAVEPTALGYNGGLYGAAALAFFTEGA